MARICASGTLRASEVVLATGALQRPLVFPDNDRPGIMLADAAAGYAQRHGVRWGRAVVATTEDSGHEAALRLLACGIQVAAVADIRRGKAGGRRGRPAAGRRGGRAGRCRGGRQRGQPPGNSLRGVRGPVLRGRAHRRLRCSA